MRVLLDENLDWRLRRDLPGHQVESVPLLGWAGVKNGELRRRTNEQFDILVTMDGHLHEQQNLAAHGLALVVLRAPSNRLADTRPIMPKLLAALPQLQPGSVTFLAA